MARTAVESRQTLAATIATKGLPQEGNGVNLKVVVRRLPPGLTQDEFEEFIGDEWLINGGKVNWMHYVPGKITSDISKPSRPSRVYLRLIHESYASQLGERVGSILFRDAKHSSGDTSLIAAPCIELSPYSRIPSNRKRADPRQGTIDKDPEFITFLESLANPKPKVTEIVPTPKPEKATSTPLIDDLREKKAKYGSLREAKNARHGHVSKRSRLDERLEKRKGELAKDSKSKRRRVPGSSDPVTILAKPSTPLDLEASSTPNLKFPSDFPKSTRVKGGPSDKPPSSSDPTAQQAQRRGEKPRPRIGDKDNFLPKLALADSTIPIKASPKEEALASAKGGKREPRPRRAATRHKGDDTGPVIDDPNLAKRSRGIVAHTGPPVTTPSILQSFKSNPPMILKKSSKEGEDVPTRASVSSIQPQAVPHPPTEPAAMRSTPASLASATNNNPHEGKQAFIKNVIASQGINPASLMETLSTFGKVTNIEIEKRKSHAYVEFLQASSLTLALRASPIKCAQGSISVVVRRPRGATGATTTATATSINGSGNSIKGINDTSSVADSVAASSVLGNSIKSRGGGGHQGSSSKHHQQPNLNNLQEGTTSLPPSSGNRNKPNGRQPLPSTDAPQTPPTSHPRRRNRNQQPQQPAVAAGTTNTPSNTILPSIVPKDGQRLGFGSAATTSVIATNTTALQPEKKANPPTIATPNSRSTEGNSEPPHVRGSGRPRHRTRRGGGGGGGTGRGAPPTPGGNSGTNHVTPSSLPAT